MVGALFNLSVSREQMRFDCHDIPFSYNKISGDELGPMALITTMVFCARSQDSYVTVGTPGTYRVSYSMANRRLIYVFSMPGFRGGGRRCLPHVKPQRSREETSRIRPISCTSLGSYVKYLITL